jgi:hypothetical protein
MKETSMSQGKDSLDLFAATSEELVALMHRHSEECVKRLAERDSSSWGPFLSLHVRKRSGVPLDCRFLGLDWPWSVVGLEERLFMLGRLADRRGVWPGAVILSRQDSLISPKGILLAGVSLRLDIRMKSWLPVTSLEGRILATDDKPTIAGEADSRTVAHLVRGFLHELHSRES